MLLRDGKLIAAAEEERFTLDERHFHAAGALGAVAAVQLADEGLIVLGKVVEGTLAADLKVGMEVELTTMPLYTDDDGVIRTTHAWRIAE